MVHILHVIVAYLQHFCLHELHNCVYTNRFEYLVVGRICLYIKFKGFVVKNCIVGGLC